MFKRLFTISLVLALFASLSMAQSLNVLRPNGDLQKIKNAKTLKEAVTASKIESINGATASSVFPTFDYTAAGTADTVTYRNVGGTWNTNFGFFGQDYMMMWFEAPADMDIKGMGFTVSDDAGAANATVSFRMVRLNWTADQMKQFAAAQHIGYYPSVGDGMNEVDPFGENATGNWVSMDENNPLPPWTDNADPAANTFDYDMWSDGGFGWPVTPVASPSTAPVYNWIATIDLGFEPQVKKGDVFAVVAVHDGITLDDDRIGFWSDNTLGYPGWKFYENGRSDATVDPGWWARLYSWDFALAVEITSDLAPTISGVTDLPTTLSTDARTVEATIVDTNPGGGDAGVASAELVYTIDGGDEVSVAMTGTEPDFSGVLPGQAPGTEVTYYVKATDVGGNVAVSGKTYSYTIFAASPGVKNLVVMNGQAANGYPQDYYWGPDTAYFDDTFLYDSWAYGALTKELVDHYVNIFEITTSGPNDYHKDVVAAWLAEDTNPKRNYLVAGDEWLGAGVGYADLDYAAGDFEYDVLGLTHSYNDVSYDGTSGQELPSHFMPVQGTLLGDAMYAKVAAIDAVDTLSIDSVLYDPIYEIGLASNWHDGFEVMDGQEVFMKAETRGIAGAPAVQEVAVGTNRETANGNKVVFMSYDPISINSTPTYSWLGRGSQSNTYQAMVWFDVWTVGVDENGVQPESYTLSQNYPNPFNPTTVISYSVPQKSEVTLKVFNLLGQEVATLVNGVQNMGAHQVNFNANNLTSGVYFYTIKAGSFTSTRKMMLIK